MAEVRLPGQLIYIYIYIYCLCYPLKMINFLHNKYYIAFLIPQLIAETSTDSPLEANDVHYYVKK